ncbi:MAG: hypothetical protein ACE5F4_02085 [Candidatus Paceibacteria bacterium]
MEPLSLKTRRIIAILFFLLFVAVLTLASAYASGYRLSGFSLTRTGGVHVSVAVSAARVLLDGTPVGTSGLFSKSFFIDNLVQGSHTVEVRAAGYRPWQKTLIVEAAFVSDASAFLVPEALPVLPIVATTTTSVATTTHTVSPDEYEALMLLFASATTTPALTELPGDSSTTSAAVPEVPDVELIIRDGNVSVRWNRDLARAPSSFCVTPRACVIEVTVENGHEEALDAVFFGGGVVYRLDDGGIFLAEVDVRQPRTLVPLYQGDAAEFRVVDDALVIKDGENLYLIAGF